MASDVPNSNGGYAFVTDHEVSPGDATEAEADFNAISRNADHLRESKMWACAGTEMAGGARAMQITGGGHHWIANALADTTPKTVIAASTLKIPLDTDKADGTNSSWLKYRWIDVRFHAVALYKILPPTAIGDAQAFLPGNSRDGFLATTSSSNPSGYTIGTNVDRTQTMPHVGFYSGAGQANESGNLRGQFTWSDMEDGTGSHPLRLGPDAHIVFKFYVASADSGSIKSGDLVCCCECNAGWTYPIFFAIHGVATWGPVWEAT